MEQFTTIFEQMRQFAVQHAPAEALRDAIPAAVLFLLAGIGISVLGAKLARVGITLGWVVAGTLAGAWVARETGFPMPLCVGAGAVMVGIIGFQTYRLWVGLAAALVISSAVLGVFGYQRVVPHVSEFEQRMNIPAVETSQAFVIPTPEQQQAYNERSPREWFQGFWGYVVQKEPDVQRNGRALGVVAFVTGLCIGLLAVRAALILSASLVGTALVTTGMFTLLARVAHDQAYQALDRHPGLVGLSVGAFLVTSIVLQTLLTRPNPKPKQAGKTA